MDARNERTESRALIPPTGAPAEGRAFATFRLGGDLFGVDAQLVREVAVVPPVTSMPHAPAAARGLANRRGQITLILDLGTLLARGATDIGPDTRLVTFRLDIGDPFGVLVDGTGEVLEVPLDRIEPRQADDPAGGAAPPHYELVLGVAKLASDLVTILEPRKFLSHIEQAIRGRVRAARQDMNPLKKERHA